jgi:hypothetical protein
MESKYLASLSELPAANAFASFFTLFATKVKESW